MMTSPKVSSRIQRIRIARSQARSCSDRFIGWPHLNGVGGFPLIAADNQPSRFLEVPGHMIGPPPTAETPLGFMTVVNQDRATAGAVARFHVMQDVADHPRLGQRDAPFIGRAL